VSFDPNLLGPQPDPSEGTPGETGATEGTPQPTGGDTAAGAEGVSQGSREAQLEAENRRLNQRVGLLSQELESRYERPPAPQAGYGQQSATPSGPPPGPPPLQVTIPEEVSSLFESEYGISRDHLASFAEGVATTTAQAVLSRAVPYAQQAAAGIVQANEASRKFYDENSDLDSYRQDLQIVAVQFMQDPSRARGRYLEQCLPEIANEVRVRFNLPIPKGKGKPPLVGPSETASVEEAQTAPGGSAGGAAGTGTLAPSRKVPERSVTNEYIQMHDKDKVNRALGGTRLGRKGLEGGQSR